MNIVHVSTVCPFGFVFLPTDFAYIGPGCARTPVLLMHADDVGPQCGLGREGSFAPVTFLFRASWMSEPVGVQAPFILEYFATNLTHFGSS